MIDIYVSIFYNHVLENNKLLASYNVIYIQINHFPENTIKHIHIKKSDFPRLSLAIIFSPLINIFTPEELYDLSLCLSFSNPLLD